MPDNRTDICNYALAEISETLVTDITSEDEGEAAIKCNALYDATKREVLRLHKWKCAGKLVVLAENDADPAFGYAKSFALPDDFIRIISINDVDPDDVDRPLFKRRGRDIYTDETTVSLDYVAEIEDSLLDPLLIKCIYTLLASKLAWVVQQNRSLREEMKEDFYKVVLPEAKNIDATEAREPIPSHRRQSNWIPGRYTSTNG